MKTDDGVVDGVFGSGRVLEVDPVGDRSEVVSKLQREERRSTRCLRCEYEGKREEGKRDERVWFRWAGYLRR